MKINYEMLYPWAKQEVVKQKSIYSDWATFAFGKEKLFLPTNGDDDSIIIEPCMTWEPACANWQRSDRAFIFSKLGIRLPLTMLEKRVLQKLNVMSIQLHPNSWAFVEVFEILCKSLGLVPALGNFFYFFEFSNKKKTAWVSE